MVLFNSKDKGLETTNHTRDQKRFMFLEAAAVWHELIIQQHIIWPSIPMLVNNGTHSVACRYTTAPISHIKPSPLS